MKISENKNKKIGRFKWLALVVMVWTVISALALLSLAANYTSDYSCFHLSASSNGKVEIEKTATGWKILAYGTDGSCGSTSTQTVNFTITNTGTKDDGTARAVNFKITTTGMGTNDTGSSKTLDATTTFLTYTATSGKGSTVCTTITIDFADISQESLGATITTTFKQTDGGTYTVDGAVVTTETKMSNFDDHTYTLVATANSGYEFFGWMSSTDLLDKDGTSTLSYAGKNENTIWPLFVKTGSAVYYIQGASPVIYYGYLDEAKTAAGASGTIVPIRDGTVYGKTSQTITLSGQTLLLPISATDLMIDTATSTDDSGALASTWIHANVAFISDQYDDGNASNSSVTGVMEPNTAKYLTLTIPNGTTVNVNSGSKLVIGGRIVSGTSNTGGVCGATAGAHSNLVVDGTLNVNTGGILSACGYVLGSGTVNIVGGSAYQPFVLMDYHDGHYTANSTKNGNFPAYRYIMQNIRPDLTISSGGRMYGYIDIYTQETNVLITTIKARHNVDCQMVIGGASDQSLIKLGTGATLSATYDSTDYVTTTSNQAGSAYYSKAGKTHMTISGGASLGSLSISVYVPVIGAKTSSSDTTDFPVPYHYDITLENGTYTIPYNLVLFPGASMTVKEDANLIVSANKFVVLDGLHDHSSRSGSVTVGGWYEYHYPSTANFQNNHSKGTYNGTANFIVDGTFTVNSGASFGGYVQTNGTGKVIMNGTASATAGVGNVNTYGIPVNKYVGRTEHTLDAWLYDVSGKAIPMVSGRTYSAANAGKHQIASYDYIVYTSPDQAASAATPVEDEALNAEISGSWYTLHVHPTDERTAADTINAAVTNKYRLEDYLWLNALCYFDSTLNPATVGTITVTTYMADGTTVMNTYSNGSFSTNDGVQVVVSNGVVYLVKAIPAKEIPDSITFSISYNDGTKTYTSVKFTVSLEAYSATLTGNDKTLADKILAYGDAAKDYFGNKTLNGSGNPGTNNSNTLISPTDEKYLAQKLDEIGITTTGASIYFDEALRLSVGYQMSGATSATVGEYTIVQIGMLVQKLDNWNMANVLTTDPDKCSATAYIVYNTAGVTITPGGADNRPNDSVDGEAAADLKTFKTSGEITFDLKAQDYKSGFAIRTYAVLQKGDQYYCVYGKQYGYGLEAYINAMYVQNATEAEDKSYNNLLEKTWALAAVAAG